MNERRGFFTTVGALAATGLTSGCASSGGATPGGDSARAQACLAYDKARQEDVTPDRALTC